MKKRLTLDLKEKSTALVTLAERQFMCQGKKIITFFIRPFKNYVHQKLWLNAINLLQQKQSRSLDMLVRTLSKLRKCCYCELLLDGLAAPVPQQPQELWRPCRKGQEPVSSRQRQTHHRGGSMMSRQHIPQCKKYQSKNFTMWKIAFKEAFFFSEVLEGMGNLMRCSEQTMQMKKDNH